MMQSSPTSEARPTPHKSASTLNLMARPLTVQSYGLTDRGLMRVTNEDQFMIATLMRALCVQHSSRPQSAVRYADDRSHVFIVTDGVGGAAGGEKASALAVGAVEEFLLNALRWLLGLDGSAHAKSSGPGAPEPHVTDRDTLGQRRARSGVTEWWPGDC
jgi:PPM family protein phosphatase